MAKTATPFFSLTSRGSIANAITTQDGRATTIVRAKPKPTDIYSLPQAYQRWLYQDYSLMWTLQSVATRQTYQSLGVPHHLTGFQYWMKYHLTNLPDIAAWWKMDDNTHATTPDTSRNGNTLTVIGASPSIGGINGDLILDGLNDRLTMTPTPSLALQGDITIMCLAKCDPTGAGGMNFVWIRNTAPLRYIDLRVSAWRPYLAMWDGSTTQTVRDDTGFLMNDGLLHHITGRLRRRNDMSIFVDGQLRGTDPAPQAPYPVTGTLNIGRNLWDWMKGNLDNIIVYNRALSDAEILLRANRRYPT